MELIAEIGQNHGGDMKVALDLIHQAKKSGADVAKFQLYDARQIFTPENNKWYDYNLKTELSREQLKLLFHECKKVNIEFMASVFDEKRLGWLEDLGVARYKIASRSIKDLELLNAVASTGKPMVVSLGMWEGHEFPNISSKNNVEYLYCVSNYPTELVDLNLAQVDFNRYAGFSDHTRGISAAVTAFSRGARIVEKHFTLDRESHGPDHVCSMEPAELACLAAFKSDLNSIL